eukprot:2289751-Pyramimonas_sp.AAC.1
MSVVDHGPEALGPVARIQEKYPSGTITAYQVGHVYRATRCKVSIRDRGRGQGRQLCIVGRTGMLAEARRLTEEHIAANGSAGGRKTDWEQRAHREWASQQGH